MDTCFFCDETFPYLFTGEFPNVAENKTALIEDSGSGFDFYAKVMPCDSAHGKSNLPILLKNRGSDQNWSVIIADGAAIGPEIADILALKKQQCYFSQRVLNICCCRRKCFGIWILTTS